MKKTILFISALLYVSFILGQTTSRTILTAAPGLRINASASAGGMGDIGVVAAPGYYGTALWQNPALLVGEEQVAGGNVSFVPWIPELWGDPETAINVGNFIFAVPRRTYWGAPLYFTNVGGHYNLTEKTAVGIGLHNFHIGGGMSVDFDGNPIQLKGGNASQLKVAIAHRFSERLTLGAGIGYWRSSLPAVRITVDDPDATLGGHGKSSALMADIGLHYVNRISISEDKDLRLQGGCSIVNIGKKQEYDVNQPIRFAPALDPGRAFLPTNLLLGGLIGLEKYRFSGATVEVDIAYQMQKLLVPSLGDASFVTAFQGIFTSFNDAPNGSTGELQEITHQVGGEIRYRTPIVMVAFRAGLFMEHENLGNRQHGTFGASVQVRGFRLDYAKVLASSNSVYHGGVKVSLSYVKNIGD